MLFALCKAVLTTCSHNDRTFALFVLCPISLRIKDFIHIFQLIMEDDSVYTISLQSNLSDIIENVKNYQW